MRDNRHPLSVVREAAAAGIKDVIVGVSGGRDSVVTLDLCCRTFQKVRPYFAYVVPGMRFQEQYLGYLERRFNVSIARVPHWMLTNILRQGALRHETKAAASVRRCRIHHFTSYIRKKLGGYWIATGEKAADSLERNAQMVRDGAVQPTRGRIFPLAWWSDSDVQSHLAREQILLPPDYRLNAESDPALRRRRGASYGSLITMAEVLKIAEKFPDDYEKIKRFFPFVEVQIQRWKQLNERGLVERPAAAAKKVRKKKAKGGVDGEREANEGQQQGGEGPQGDEGVQGGESVGGVEGVG